MGLYLLNGTISRLGQSVFDNDLVIYAFIEIVDAEGVRTLVKKVAVAVDVQSAIGEGTAGQFYFDAVFVFGRRYLCQFWGMKTATRSVVDGTNFRRILAVANLFWGVLLTPLLGYGLPCLIAGIGQTWSLFDRSADREQFFAGCPIATEELKTRRLPLPERLGLQLRAVALDYLRRAFSDRTSRG